MSKKIRYYAAVLIIVLGVLAVTTIVSYRYFSATAGDYMITSVIVRDAAYGESPVLEVQREVHQQFQARWLVDVYDEEGRRVCDASGGPVTFTPGRPLPDKVTLFGWWMNAREDQARVCAAAPIPPGLYVAETTWIVPTSQERAYIIRAKSNVFEVMSP